MMNRNMMESFMDFLKKGVSPYHVTKEISDQLETAGFIPLRLEEAWELKAGEGYRINLYDAGEIAFVIPKNVSDRGRFRIAAAHTDFPCLRIKPSPDLTKEGYRQLNTEVYGGAIYSTWLDRPLSIAGKVALKSNHVMKPETRLVDFARPVVTIPNLAIHMNRKINEGVALNPQKDLLPIGGMEKDSNKGHVLLEVVAREMGVEAEEILDYDLRVYNQEAPAMVGFEEDLLSASRLDNLSSVWCILQALREYKMDASKEGGLADVKGGQAASAKEAGQCGDICLAAFFDHEEIGSRSKQGAGSVLLRDVLERIGQALAFDREAMMAMIYRSIFLSADVAHALHPNHPDKNDITTKPVLNQGFCIKESGVQAYLTDPEVMAMVRQICSAKDIPLQRFINRSDERGGSTLGAIASSYLPIRGADVGIPVLAMHSARELMGCEDLDSFYRLFEAYYAI